MGKCRDKGGGTHGDGAPRKDKAKSSGDFPSLVLCCEFPSVLQHSCLSDKKGIQSSACTNVCH